MPDALDSTAAHSLKLLQKLEAVIGELEAQDASEDTSTGSELCNNAVQLVLELRENHRQIQDSLRATSEAENATRKTIEAAWVEQEGARYFCSSIQNSAERCRSMATPELSKLQPHLDSGVSGSQPSKLPTTLAGQQDWPEEFIAEFHARKHMEGEVAACKKKLATETSELQQRKAYKPQLLKRVAEAAAGLEPICLGIRSHPKGSPPSGFSRESWCPSEVPVASKEVLRNLPAPLFKVYSEFQALHAFGVDSLTTVGIETDKEPPAKRLRMDDDTPLSSTSPRVTVEVAIDDAMMPRGSDADQSVVLAFTYITAPLTAVAVKGFFKRPTRIVDASACLWQLEGDDEPPEGPEGRPYVWAQVLAGIKSGKPGEEEVAARHIANGVRERLLRSIWVQYQMSALIKKPSVFPPAGADLPQDLMAPEVQAIFVKADSTSESKAGAMPASWPDGGQSYTLLLQSGESGQKGRKLSVLLMVPPLGVAASVFRLSWEQAKASDGDAASTTTAEDAEAAVKKLQELQEEINVSLVETWFDKGPVQDAIMLTAQLQTLRRGLDKIASGVSE